MLGLCQAYDWTLFQFQAMARYGVTCRPPSQTAPSRNDTSDPRKSPNLTCTSTAAPLCRTPNRGEWRGKGGEEARCFAASHHRIDGGPHGEFWLDPRGRVPAARRAGVDAGAAQRCGGVLQGQSHRRRLRHHPAGEISLGLSFLF